MDGLNKASSKFKAFILLDRIQTKIEQGFVSLGLILLTLMLLASILSNLFTGSTLPWASELSQYIMIWVVFIGASILIRSSGHVNMDLLIRFLPDKAKLYLEIFIYLVVFVFLSYLTYVGWNMTSEVYSNGQTMAYVNMPMAWAYLSYPIGFFLMAINSLKIVIIKLRTAIGGEVN